MAVGTDKPSPEETTIRLLDVDPDLSRSIRPERREEARRNALVTAVRVEPGPWAMETLALDHTPLYGLLLCDGLASRTVVLDGIAGASLLGRGDLIPPRDTPPEALVPATVSWRVIAPLSVAVLDERFLFNVRRWPELVAVLFERLATQMTRRSVHRTLCQLPRVADRLHAMLWLLAERWGRMTPQGVLLPLQLTHDLLGQLVGAKRPTVSLALKQLAEQGTIHRRADGSWLLGQAWTGGAPPAALGPDAVALLDDPGRGSARKRPAHPSTPVAAWEAPTGLDSGEPRWRR
jgi:CRP/FNR family cyclic AMP-dependent transcriptional regulator